jgi:diguanylate cyclase (GGDEF)-like protein
MEMERRRWPAVLLTAPCPDFAGLCRASRRLQPQAAIFGLCSPAAEPLVRPLAGTSLTDYVICPPTRRDVERIVQAADAASAAGTPTGRPANLAPHVLAELLAATNAVPTLEQRLASLASRLLGLQARWVNADDLPADAQPLLLAAGHVPRALTCPAAAQPLPPAAQEFLAAVQQCLPALWAAAERTESLHRLAITDALTGAYNRRYFYHLTDQILRQAGEKNLRASLLLYDIDDFKRYNDQYGYAAGDEILRDTAALMRQICRQRDVVARIGGDEFAVLFWDADQPRHPGSQPLENALELADRFRRALHKHKFSSLGPEATGTLTISGGLARFTSDGHTCRQLLRSADAALKAAKRSGKDAVRLVGAE